MTLEIDLTDLLLGIYLHIINLDIIIKSFTFYKILYKMFTSGINIVNSLDAVFKICLYDLLWIYYHSLGILNSCDFLGFIDPVNCPLKMFNRLVCRLCQIMKSSIYRNTKYNFIGKKDMQYPYYMTQSQHMHIKIHTHIH